MGRQARPQPVAARGCDRCVHRPVCILYHGHGQLDLRFGDTYGKDPDEFVRKLDERLASKCGFYLEVQPVTEALDVAE